MKLKSISIEFTEEEIEAIHYALNIGILKYKKDKCQTASSWIYLAEVIREKLPTKLKFSI